MSTTNQDVEFLIDLQNELKFQDKHDNDCQASPRFWVLMDYRFVPAHEDYDDGFYEYHYHDGDYIKFEDYEWLKEFILEHYEDEIEEDEDLKELLENPETSFDELWEYITDNLNDDGYFNTVFVKKEEFIVPNTMFLTKEEAKNHIRLNHYHYTSEVHTYAMTAWRAPKVERLLRILENFEWDKININ